VAQFDCGVHPAYSGLSSLPMIDDDFDISAVDLLLVTHFHLDHCASLPYILYKVRMPLPPSRTLYRRLARPWCIRV
jgi:Cft2 family RNA processing exonuclease